MSGFVAWGVTSPLLPLAYYFGSDKVTALVGNMPEFISTGMDIAGGLLPAMGFAMLARMIMKKTWHHFSLLDILLLHILV